MQEKQISLQEADTIIITEMLVHRTEENEQITRCPNYLNSRSVRVAHLYGKLFQNIRSAFMVAGLKKSINVKFAFKNDK